MFNIELDKELNGIGKWLPWVGNHYTNLPYEDKLLIVGESHYKYNEDGESDDSIIDNMNKPDFTRHFINNNGVGRDDNKVNIIYNIEKAIIGSIANFNHSEFWHRVSYFNFVQRVVANVDDRPSDKDYIDGYSHFVKFIKVLKPSKCIVCGVRAADFNGAFVEACKIEGYELKHHGDRETKVGDVKCRIREIISKENSQEKTQIIFIRHPSRYFNWEEWNNVINNWNRINTSC